MNVLVSGLNQEQLIKILYRLIFFTMGSLTLYRLCLLKTSWLLKNSFWNEVYDTMTGGTRANPFTCVPSPIIDDLLTCVLQLTTFGSLKVTDLYHLLTSGRVEHFSLDDILLSSEEFVSILMSLSVACQNLRSVILRNVFFSDHYASLHKTKGYMKKAALECVLSISPLLESVESCVEFDLKAIRNCERLRVLKLNFVSKSPLCDFLEDADGSFWPNNSLTILELYEDARHPVQYRHIVPIVQHCTNLSQINTDVSRSLDYLHAEELYKGTLSAQYNLQKCYLGSVHFSGGSATITSVHIATLTCPQMKDLDVLANDHEVIYALSDFPCLNSLLLQWESTEGGDFQLGVQLLLEKSGAGLKDLHLVNFLNVDFAVVAAHCPNLEKLKLEFLSEFRGREPPSECLKSLRTLHLENIEAEFGCRGSTLSMLLACCTDLQALHLHSAACLNDQTLSGILRTNSLAKVKDAVVLDSSLSAVGVRQMVTHMRALEYLHFSSSQILFEEAAVIVHEINPLVIMRSDVD